AGIRKTLASSGAEDHAIVLRQGSDAEMSSAVEVNNLLLVGGAPGVRKGADGKPLVSGENVLVVAKTKIGTDGITNVTVRGVPENVWEFRPDVKLIAGEKAKAGTNEVVIGRGIRGRFEGMEIGKTFEL